MKCPFRKITTTIEAPSGMIVREEYPECYGEECPHYRSGQYESNGVKLVRIERPVCLAEPMKRVKD